MKFCCFSISKVEYVVVASFYEQLMWIKQQLKYFGVVTHINPLYCDNTSALNMVKNPIQHKRTIKIYVRHHFQEDNIERLTFACNYERLKIKLLISSPRLLVGSSSRKTRLKLGMLKID